MPLTAGEAAALAHDRREAARLHDESYMLLVWLHHSFPAQLPPSSPALRGPLDARPADRLAALLADGVVLADVVSALAPARLAASSILRVAPRNALSAPPARLPASAAPAISNVDARQRVVQYNSNSRRVLAAVKLLLDPLRTTPSAPGRVDDFVANAPAVPPTKDLRPALRLALLVLAAAVYGPDKKPRDVFWQLPSDSVRNTFHKSLTSVAQALDLPPPDTLYADGPTSPPLLSRPSPASASASAPAPIPAHDPGIVELSRKHDAEAFAPPLLDDAARPQHAMLDDPMGGRKISLVTDDENNSRGSISPTRLSAAAAAPDDFPGEKRVAERFVQNMQAMHPRSPVLDDYVEDDHHTASDEYYTPHEHTPGDHSPVPPVAHRTVEEQSTSPSMAARMQEHETALPLHPQFPGVAPYRVDETVRQSVTSSITRQISAVPEFEGAVDSHREALSGDMSSLDLGPSDAVASTDQAPIDFMNPAYLLSPSGSDVPEPSNQWQIHRQKTRAADVMSPQQLYSPPQMPRRLSRTTAATQMTPPQAPVLFRSESPHLSVSSADGRVNDDAQLQSRNSRVSFAPTYVSPGGLTHPLGQPLRESQTSTQEQSQESRQSGGNPSFALPPSASRGAASPSLVHDDTLERMDDPAVTGEEEEEKEHAELGHETEDRDYAEVEEDEEEEGYDPESMEQYDRDGDDEAHPVYGDDFDPEKDEVFEQVEEYAVTSSEHDDERYHFENADKPESVPSSSREQVKQSPRTALATAGLGSAGGDRQGDTAQETVSGNVQDDGEESQHSDVFKEAEAMVAADADLLTPMQTPKTRVPTSARLQSGYPTALKYREVPPTPPSPPTVAALVESFTARRHTADSVDARPVSTMAPSAGLFQKLIAVWKSSEDTGHEASDRDFAALHSGVASVYRPDHNVSQSTQESTLPSGDTDVAPPKALTRAESPRSRRRRAIRMEPGSPVQRDLQRSQDMSTESGRQSADERGSIASFSDAFSSEKDRAFMYTGQGEGYDWDEAMKGDQSAGIPVSSSASHDPTRPTLQHDNRSDTSRDVAPSGSRPPLPPSPHTSQRKARTHSTSTQAKSVVSDGSHIRVDRRHLDWLTRELLNARDALSRQELQMTFQETQRMEQEEILLLDKQNAESIVGAMKHILTDRENELKDARNRLSVAIEGVGTTQDRSSLSSRNSVSAESQGFSKLITEGHTKLHIRIDESDVKTRGATEQMTKETRGLWAEVQRALVQQMAEMTEKRDEELEVLRRELQHRQKLVDDLQKSSASLQSKNDGFRSEVSKMRMDKDRAAHRYQLEMAHVSAQVELVNEFSKKLHDNFRETENLRQQVLQYQDKLSHITSTSGVSQRQIKELREAVTRANDECARLRREADLAKRKGMEAVRRAEELEELRHKDAAAHSARQFPDRQARTDSGSFRSHEPIRPAGQNRPGGTGTGARYHAATRTRGMPASPTPAQKAWLVIKDKIGGIVTGKEINASRRRPAGANVRREPSRAGSASRSSGSNSRSRTSPREGEILPRSRSASVNSRSSKASGSSIRSGPVRSRSGSRGRVSPVADTGPYMHDSPRSKEGDHIRAAHFM